MSFAITIIIIIIVVQFLWLTKERHGVDVRDGLTVDCRPSFLPPLANDNPCPLLLYWLSVSIIIVINLQQLSAFLWLCVWKGITLSHLPFEKWGEEEKDGNCRPAVPFENLIGRHFSFLLRTCLTRSARIVRYPCRLPAINPFPLISHI